MAKLVDATLMATGGVPPKPIVRAFLERIAGAATSRVERVADPGGHSVAGSKPACRTNFVNGKGRRGLNETIWLTVSGAVEPQLESHFQ